jgi:hypothetical protein
VVTLRCSAGPVHSDASALYGNPVSSVNPLPPNPKHHKRDRESNSAVAGLSRIGYRVLCIDMFRGSATLSLVSSGLGFLCRY